MLLGGMRRSTGGGGGGGSSGEFSIMFVNGPIKFQSEEGVLYSRLFHIVRRPQALGVGPFLMHPREVTDIALYHPLDAAYCPG